MSFELTDAEWAMVEHLPEIDLVDLAAELSLLPPEVIDRRTLVVECVLSLADLARKEGLPFSKYDKEDLEALPREHLVALANALGLQPDPAVLLTTGQRKLRAIQKTRPHSRVALMLPMLLTAVARACQR